MTELNLNAGAAADSGTSGTLTVIDAKGQAFEVAGRRGGSVMEAIRDDGNAKILALCGGCCSCATCHVYVDEAHLTRLPPLQSDEDDLLDGSSYRQLNSRLSCQIPFTQALNGLRVTIAPED